MLLYIAISFLLFYLGWVLRAQARIPGYITVIIFAILFVFVGFRYQIGCDWESYEVHFTSRQGVGFTDIPTIESFYWYLVSALNVLELPYQFLHIVVSSIFFFFLYRFSSRFHNPILVLAFAFPLFIFGLPMSALRQALAAAFIMESFICLVDKRWFLSAFLIIIASQFHFSAIIFIVFPFLLSNGLSPLSLALSSVLLIVVINIANTIETISSYSSLIIDRYSQVENSASGALLRSSVYFLFGIVARFKILPFLRTGNLAGLKALLNLMSIMMIFFPLLALFMPTVLDRFAYYFAALLGPIAILAHDLNKGKSGDFILLFLFIALLTFFIFWFLLSWQLPLCFVPYKSILDL